MQYLLNYLLFNSLSIVFLTIYHDLLILKKEKDQELMFNILLLSPGVLLSKLNIKNTILALLFIFVLSPFIILKNIHRMNIKSKNKISKEYSEYFYFHIHLKTKTLRRLKRFLKENKIPYNPLYLNNVSSFAIKAIHEIPYKINKDEINISTTNKEDFLEIFSSILELDRKISDHIFNLIKEEISEWILENRSLDGIDNMYVFNDEIIVKNKFKQESLNETKNFERKTVTFPK